MPKSPRLARRPAATPIRSPRATSARGAPTDAMAQAEKSDATRRAYRSDFVHFGAWCKAAGRHPLPASVETAAAYLASLADGVERQGDGRHRRVGALNIYAGRVAWDRAWSKPNPEKT